MSILSSILTMTLLFAAGNPQILVLGEVSDSQCAFNIHSTNGSHDEMIKTKVMGETAEECAHRCIEQNGGKYVLVDAANKKIYRLADQEQASKFAGKRVRARGVYDKDSDLFTVSSMVAR